MDMNLSKPQYIMKDRESWGAIVRGVAKSWTTEQQQSLESKILHCLPQKDLKIFQGLGDSI